jgi:hypothetical chaperone protein
MPLLGLGSYLIKKNLPVPNGLYFELATWATINFTYTQANEREVRELAADAREPEKLKRLLRTLHRRLGHRIAFAIEDAKMGLSDAMLAPIALGFLERELAAQATRDGFDRAIKTRTDRLFTVASKCIADAGLKPSDIDTIFFTGGSSRVPAVREAIRKAAPDARAAAGSDFLSVALGLTREAQRRFA